MEAVDMARFVSSSFMSSRSHAVQIDDATRAFLKDELDDSFHMDDNVLGLLDMPTDPERAKLVGRMFSQFQHNPDMQAQLDSLPRFDPTSHDDENDTHKITEMRENEEKMYRPLQNIFNWIANWDQPVGFSRKWVILANQGPTLDVSLGNHNRKPGLALIEKAKTTRLEADSHPRWRQISACVEIKFDPKEGPSNKNLLKSAVLETIDQMRLHINSRPFLRWVFGLLICGTNFYVLYLDRAGGAITSVKSIINNQELFIEIVLHMTTATRAQLGEDPDLQYGRDVRDHRREHLALAPTSPWDDSFPVYTFPRISGSGQIWISEPPVFVVYGLLGRGTSVWKAVDIDNNKLILKYSWRSVTRTSESVIYNSIQSVFREGVPGLCRFVDGADAAWNADFLPAELSQLTGPAINPRRAYLSNGLSQDHDRVVHRLLLKTSGEPISNFKDCGHLVKILISALQAHKELADAGILHRDISAGNILIATDTIRPGILADVELAKLLPSYHPGLADLLPSTAANTRQPEITCTAHFASYHVLTAIFRHETETFIPLIRHDLESFFWVMLWVILIRSLKYKALKKEPTSKEELTWKACVHRRKEVLKTLYGPHGVSRLISERYSVMGASNSDPEVLFPLGYIEDPEFDAFHHLYARLRDVFRPVIASPKHDVTHEQVILALDPDYNS